MVHILELRGRVMVFNATFSNISAISWRSALLVKETGVPGENHRLVASHWQTLLHNVVSSMPRLSGIRTHNAIVVIGTDCIGSCKFNYHSCKFNYHMITTHVGTLSTINKPDYKNSIYATYINDFVQNHEYSH